MTCRALEHGGRRARSLMRGAGADLRLNIVGNAFGIQPAQGRLVVETHVFGKRRPLFGLACPDDDKSDRAMCGRLSQFAMLRSNKRPERRESWGSAVKGGHDLARTSTPA